MNKKFILLSIFLIASCAFNQNYGKKIDPVSISSIQKSVTTKSEIETLFGTDYKLENLNNGDQVMHYKHTEMSGNFITSPHFASQEFDVTLDQNNRVKDYIGSQKSIHPSNFTPVP